MEATPLLLVWGMAQRRDATRLPLVWGMAQQRDATRLLFVWAMVGGRVEATPLLLVWAAQQRAARLLALVWGTLPGRSGWLSLSVGLVLGWGDGMHLRFAGAMVVR